MANVLYFFPLLETYNDLDLVRALKCLDREGSTHLLTHCLPMYLNTDFHNIQKLPLKPIFFKSSFEKQWSRLESQFYQPPSLSHSTFLLVKYILELLFLFCLSYRRYSKIVFCSVVALFYRTVTTCIKHDLANNTSNWNHLSQHDFVTCIRKVLPVQGKIVK